MAGLTAPGIGSGLDINGLVSQLVSAERQPATARLNRREANLQTELSGVGAFKGALSELQSAVKGLTDTAKFSAMKATVGDSGLLTVSADSAAQAGNYRVEVMNLAEAQKLATPANKSFASATSPFGSGTLTFRFGSYNDAGEFAADPSKTSKEVVIAPADNTLQGVRDAINKADVGVTANIVNDGGGYRLALSVKNTGLKNALEITVNDADGNHSNTSGLSLLAFDGTTKNLEQTRAAKDAKVVVDGLTITNGTNTLSEAIQGVTLNLKSTKPGTTTDLTVTKDTGTVTSAINSFVSSFNKFITTTKALTAYNPQTGERGPMLGDAGVRSASDQIKRTVGATVKDNALDSLSDIGISAQREGNLKLDTSVLQKALEKDPQAVANLLAGPANGAPGIAKRMDEFLGKLLGSDGPLDSRAKSLNQRIDSLSDDRQALSRRLQSLETRYRAQFKALDDTLSKLTATGNFLTQQLAGLANNNSSR